MTLTRQHESDWLCRQCPAGKGALCGALTRRQNWRENGRPCSIRQSIQNTAANEVICSQGGFPDHVFALCRGWALRFVELADGRRQNLAVLLPGDMQVCALFQDKLHYSVEAVTALRITRFASADLKTCILGDANMLAMIGRACAAEQRAADERAINLGRRSAEERVMHLLLGLVERMSQHRVQANHPYAFPLLQRHIADLTGLTPVHVSRVMTEFRNAGVMKLSKGILTITDLAQVEQIAQLK